MSKPKPLYVVLASLVQARLNCYAQENMDWFKRHEERLESLVKEHMPSGSGFDSGTTLDLEESTGEKLVFNTSFHHMNDVGMYDGWTEHTVTVRPSLLHGFLISIGGRNRNDIKTYVADMFNTALDIEVQD